jgi:hypothetical protein
MEPITMASIYMLTTKLAEKAFDTSFETVVGKATEKGLSWIKSLLWENDTPSPALVQLAEKPESEGRKQMVAGKLISDLEDHPENLSLLKEVVAALSSMAGDKVVTQKNVVTGTIISGGSTVVGDNNSIH